MATPEYIPFRSRLKLPTWLRRFVAVRIMWAIALHCDAVVELFVRAVKLRYAGVYSDETLPLIAREHSMIRGLYETNVQFAKRLDGAWLAHAERGGPYALLEQVWAHYQPNMFGCDLLYPSGAHWSMNPTTGAITQDLLTFSAGFPTLQFARWVLIYQWPTAIDDDGNWDDGDPDWDDGGVWDYSIDDLTAAQVDDLRAVPTSWNNEHCLGQLMLLDPGAEIWDLPDALWDDGDDDWDTPGGEPVVIEIR